MSETTALAPAREAAHGPMPQAGGLDVLTLGRVLAKSGYFRDAKDEAQAIVKILYGQELGVGPVSSMMGIHIIEGKPAPSAQLIASRVKGSRRYDYRVIERSEKRCELAWFDNQVEVGRSCWSVEDAQRAGLAGKDNWKKYPRAMLFGRAISEGARVHCADLFGGAPVYTPEELGAEVDAETGEVRAPSPEEALASAGRRLFAVAREAGMDTKNLDALRHLAGKVLGRDVPHLRELTAAERHAVADWIERPPLEERDPLDDEPFTDQPALSSCERTEQGTYSSTLLDAPDGAPAQMRGA